MLVDISRSVFTGRQFFCYFYKHYKNTLIQICGKLHLQKAENFQIKTDIFHISAQNINCGYSLELPRQGSSYSQSMFLSKNKKNNVYLCKPQF